MSKTKERPNKIKWCLQILKSILEIKSIKFMYFVRFMQKTLYKKDFRKKLAATN